MTHKNTKVLRPVYNFVKVLLDEGVKVSKISREVEKEFDISLSGSTIRLIRRSKNYKQYRLSHKRVTKKELAEYRSWFHQRMQDRANELVLARVIQDKLTVAISKEQHWYSNIPILRTWFKWFGGNK